MGDTFEQIDISTRAIEADLEAIQKSLDALNQMRVQAAYMLSDLMTVIDAHTWEDVSELIGLTRIGSYNMGGSGL